MNQIDLKGRRAYDMAWQRRMFDAGWPGINWPKEFGGRGMGYIEQFLFADEAQRAFFPFPFLTSESNMPQAIPTPRLGGSLPRFSFQPM